MSRQYSNFNKFFETKTSFKFLSDEKEVVDSRIVRFQCKIGHITQLSVNSFINKRSNMKNNLDHLCTNCFSELKKLEQFNNEKQKGLENSGHELLTLEDRKVTYKCGNCDTVNNSFLCNFQSNKGRCPKCQNEDFKNSLEDVKNLVEEVGYKLILYKNCHEVTMECKNGHVYTNSLSSLKRGRRCPECSGDRRKETIIEKYGVDNLFKSEEIKNKIKLTKVEKYGVDHHMKNKEILQKARDTCKEKYGVAYAFNQLKVYEKIRSIHKQKYGVEYPLQSEEIMLKAMNNLYQIREYELPKTKRIIKLMGYEDTAINMILSDNKILDRNIEEDNILTSAEVPTIKYNDEIGKTRTYFPDIFIKDTNVLCEVKCIYTFNYNAKRNFLKFMASNLKGYIIYVIIFINRKQLFDIWKFENGNPVSKIRNINKFDETINIEDDGDIFLKELENSTGMGFETNTGKEEEKI